MSVPDHDGGHSPVGAGDELEPMPSGAAELFGAAAPAAQCYARHLATTGVEWGLIGPRELPRLWTRHILNCALAAELIVDGDDVGDVGSGAGLPGIPLALMRPEASFALIEPMERRCDWLRMVVDDLGLGNVRIVRSRVEDLADEEMFTAVTARAVKSLKVLIEWCAPVLAPDGRLLALKGEKAQQEMDDAGKIIRRLGLRPPKLHVIDSPLVDTPTRVVEVVRP